jgi:Asp-tRNA(Asn)/Glu-tRNA(Gln) amidotransferase C subunit
MDLTAFIVGGIVGSVLGAALATIFVTRRANRVIRSQAALITGMFEMMKQFETTVLNPMLKARQNAMLSALIAKIRSNN